MKTFHNLSTGRNKPDSSSARSKKGGHKGQGVKIPANSGPVKHKRTSIGTPQGEPGVHFDDGFDIKRGL